VLCLMYDTTNPQSFAYVANFHRRLTGREHQRLYPQHAKIPCLFLENKADLVPVQQVRCGAVAGRHYMIVAPRATSYTSCSTVAARMCQDYEEEPEEYVRRNGLNKITRYSILNQPISYIVSRLYDLARDPYVVSTHTLSFTLSLSLSFSLFLSSHLSCELVHNTVREQSQVQRLLHSNGYW